MTPIGSTNDENICVVFFMSYLRLHLHIDDQTMHQRKNLKGAKKKMLYFHYYTRSFSEIWRVETLI